MRPLRFLLTIATSVVAFFILLYVGPWRSTMAGEVEEQRSMGTYFNWRTPSSLFPPSAIISLTDDNSTFFLSRPAAFGPLLPPKSLSGQVWIGSGFGADQMMRGGLGTSAEGELGCSDVPGWNNGGYAPLRKSGPASNMAQGESTDASGPRRKRDTLTDEEDESEDASDTSDGTDDHLHHPLRPSGGLRTNGQSGGTVNKPTHADIQSLQESAEIAGKIVLLSRGGCGFLEKAKWVQRRGGVALIVGDHIRGRPLVTMYARGDTSNVTIPSVFTAYTTAHMLSSLIPSGGRLVGSRLGEVGIDSTAVGVSSSKGENTPNGDSSAVAVSESLETSESASHHSKANKFDNLGATREKHNRLGWLNSIFGSYLHIPRRQSTESNAQPGWVLQDQISDDDDASLESSDASIASSTFSDTGAEEPSKPQEDDGFVIGVQDWRDPDLVGGKNERASSQLSASDSIPVADTELATPDGLEGGSVVPGSGEYGKAVPNAAGTSTLEEPVYEDQNVKQSDGHSQEGQGWLRTLFGSRNTVPEASTNEEERPRGGRQTPENTHDSVWAAQSPEEHDGLWVTLTPTSMSPSPFFDTLLVLVVSPLVTLTVVYALLLLRSRIRRRRWRAPKSVVERLPVRTYQTASSAPSGSPAASVSSTPVTDTTPLLTATARAIRPRSRTTTDVSTQASSSLRSDDDIATPSFKQAEEKRAAALDEWRKRYGGKQRECVVCLEEYVDGVSRVMSLPCGHEFHAECMYVSPPAVPPSSPALTPPCAQKHPLAHHPSPHLPHLQRRRCALSRPLLVRRLGPLFAARCCRRRRRRRPGRVPRRPRRRCRAGAGCACAQR